MKLESSKISLSTDTISTELHSRVSEILRRACSLVVIVRSGYLVLLRVIQAYSCFTTGKQKITDQIAQLKFKDKDSPKIPVLEQELVRAEAESLVAEAQLSNTTREKIKAAFNYQFDALQEHCEKVAMIAGYGKHMLQLIDDTPVTPGEARAAYDGYDVSKRFVRSVVLSFFFFFFFPVRVWFKR